jgi:hypothetical protein
MKGLDTMPIHADKSQIQALVDGELRHGDKRSAVYRAAMLDILDFKMNGTPLPQPYRLGSTEFDAYCAGNERGHALYRKTKGTR